MPDDASHAVELGSGVTLRKNKCGRLHEAVCTLRVHPLGWELVLDVDGTFLRSQVCRTRDEILTHTESWRATLIDRGWR